MSSNTKYMVGGFVLAIVLIVVYLNVMGRGYVKGMKAAEESKSTESVSDVVAPSMIPA